MSHVHAARAPRKVFDPSTCSEDNAERACRCLDMAREAIKHHHPGVARTLLFAAHRTASVGVRNEGLRLMILAEVAELQEQLPRAAEAPPMSALAWAIRALNSADKAVEAGNTERASVALQSAVRFLRCVPAPKRAGWIKEALRITAEKAGIETERRAA